MNYKLPDGAFAVDPQGSAPTITLQANQASTHWHVQVKDPVAQTWSMVLDHASLGSAVPIAGGPIRSASDFPGKTFFWDITLANQSESDPVEAVLHVTIQQDGRTLFTTRDDHQFTGRESYYEYLQAS